MGGGVRTRNNRCPSRRGAAPARLAYQVPVFKLALRELSSLDGPQFIRDHTRPMTDLQVTVGIPTFNRSKLLREAIASVLSQTLPSFRLVISDNASSDDTREVVTLFDDPRIAYSRSNDNIGMIPNFNRVIQLCTTQYLTLLPDDDILYPGYLEAVIGVLEKYPNVGVVHTAFDLIDEEPRVLIPNIAPLRHYQALKIESGDAYLRRSLTMLWPICFSSAIYRTVALREAGGMRDDEQPFADLPLWMRIARTWDYAFLKRSLVGFRDHPETATRQIRSDSLLDTDHDLAMLYAQSRHTRRVDFLNEANFSTVELRDTGRLQT